MLCLGKRPYYQICLRNLATGRCGHIRPAELQRAARDSGMKLSRHQTLHHAYRHYRLRVARLHNSILEQRITRRLLPLRSGLLDEVDSLIDRDEVETTSEQVR